MNVFYRNDTPPIDLSAILDAAKITEDNPKAYHNSVKHRPDSWGFNIESAHRDGFLATVCLRLFWKLDSSERPRYTRLKHVKRIAELFAEQLERRQMAAAYDLMEITISVDGDEFNVQLRIEVLRRPDFERIVTLGTEMV